jgi:hypothetical protein
MYILKVRKSQKEILMSKIGQKIKVNHFFPTMIIFNRRWHITTTPDTTKIPTPHTTKNFCTLFKLIAGE